jgi:putative peptidoglycan lipid II flippase
LLAVPAAAAFIAMPDLLIATLFQRGAFGESQTAATAMALVAYSTGLPAYILVKVMGPAFFARKDTKTPVIIASICVLVNIILNLILMQFLFHAGLALATALSAWLNILLMGWVLKRRGHMVWDARFKRRLPAIFLSAIVMAVGLWVSVTYLTSPMAAEELARILNLAVLVLAGASVFGLVALVSGATSLTDFKRLLKRDDG